MTPSNQVSEGRPEESLFAEPQEGGLTFVVLLRIIAALVLFFGGIYVMGLSFSIPEYAIELFMAGLIAVTVGCIISFTKFTKR